MGQRDDGGAWTHGLDSIGNNGTHPPDSRAEQVLETLKPLADKRKRKSLTDGSGEPKLELGPKVGELGC